MSRCCIGLARGVETVVTGRAAIKNIRVIYRRTRKGHCRMTDTAIVVRRYVIADLAHCDHVIVAR